MSARTPSQFTKSIRPVQTTIMIRSRTGLEILAECRKRHISVSAMIDTLLQRLGDDILSSPKEAIVIQKQTFDWPQPYGLR